VNGLALADGLIQSRQARNLILATSDTITKRIHPQDRSTRVVFGDGAAATWITAGDQERGLIDIECSTCGAYYDRIIIPAGGCRLPSSETTSRPETDSSGNVRTPENFYMDGLAVLAIVNSRVPDQIQRVLQRNQLQTSDIDLFLFHQASKPVLDSLTSILRLEQRQVYRNLQKIGNTFSASIPLALEDAFDEGVAQRGNLVIMSGFGIGLAWATALIRL
jgi:3-oxoacyl-[acyl-carrier-protein] synthase-3